LQHRSDDQPDDPDLIGVHPELAPRAGEPVVQKRFGSAFFKTDLEKALRRIGAKTLYVCGLATFGCVNATVMCAVCEGYDTIVVQDAHGAQDFPDSSAKDVIAHFNAAWERAGAQLMSAKNVTY